VNLVLKADADKAAAGLSFPLRIEGRTPTDPPLVRSARFPLNLPFTSSHTAVWITARK
jgi:hypothetical protein